MKRSIGIVLALAVWFVHGLILADVPEGVAFQGYLTDASGAPLSGEHELAFTLYGSEDGTDSVWTDTRTVTVEGGAFSLVLGGSGNPLDAGVFSGDQSLWLGVSVDGGTELQPRSPVTSVPYATRAAVADNALDTGAVQALIDEGGYLTEVVETDPTVNALAKAVLNCGAGEVAKWDGTAWICAADAGGVTEESDPLYSAAPAAGISSEDIGHWNACYAWGDHGDANYLTEETDPLVNELAKAFLQCASGDVARFNGLEWECSSDGNTDALAALSCAENEVAKWDGLTWVCAADANTTYGASDFVPSNQYCPEGQIVSGFGVNGNPVCREDANTTYGGGNFALSGQNCPDGQMVSGVGESGDVTCREDANTTYDAADFVPSNQNCSGNQMASGFDAVGNITCRTDADALAALSCADGETARWDGSNWTCAAPFWSDGENVNIESGNDTRIPLHINAVSPASLVMRDRNSTQDFRFLLDEAGQRLDVRNNDGNAVLLSFFQDGRVQVKGDFSVTGNFERLTRLEEKLTRLEENLPVMILHSNDVVAVGDRLWARDPSPSGQTWAAAQTYCSNLELAGLDDWRMPTISELRLLVKDCPNAEPGGACGVTDECNLGDDSRCYTEAACNSPCSPGDWHQALRGDLDRPQWTVTVSSAAGYACWRLRFSDGDIDLAPKTNSLNMTVRCVR